MKVVGKVVGKKINIMSAHTHTRNLPTPSYMQKKGGNALRSVNL